MNNIYVAYTIKTGGKGWLKDPEPFFDGTVFLAFQKGGVVAGLPADKATRKATSAQFNMVLTDALDRLGIPWANPAQRRLAVKVVEGDSHELYLATIQLAGPLPWKVASQIKATRGGSPVKEMTRFGG